MLEGAIETLYHNLINFDEGEIANYIPQLAKVNPDLFAISMCDVHGNQRSWGDAKIKFCLQSCSKPITYCIARKLVGECVHRHVGHEPSGQKFNAFVLNDEGKPHNPLINSGSIATCSLILPDEEPSVRFDYVLKTLKQMSASNDLDFDNSVYLSEKKHASRNKALAYFMEERGVFHPSVDINSTLEFYFQACSIRLNAIDLATITATLANKGVCPLTEERVFDENITRDCLSLMYTCGMYDYSGQFSYKIGLPAKSGVSGCIMLVIPNRAGICIWSPRLDKIGNSAKGIEFCKRLIELVPTLHIFNNLPVIEDNASEGTTNNEHIVTSVLINCASKGHLEKMKRLVASSNVDLNKGDYDSRSPLHLACANGQFEVIRYLIKDQKVDYEVKDRWGNTPLHELKLNCEEIPEEILTLFENLNHRSSD